MEHRWGERRQLILRVRLCGTLPNATGWLTDISLSGAHVRSLAALTVMSQVTIEVDEHLSGETGCRPPQLQGRVVRRGPRGLGIEWEEFASETLAEIWRIAIPIHPDRIVGAVDELPGPGLWPLATCATSHGMRDGCEP